MTLRILTLATSAVALAWAASAVAEGLLDPGAASESAAASEMEATLGEASYYGAGQFEECVTITFEGGGQGTPIGDVPGTGTEFPPPWRTLTSWPPLCLCTTKSLRSREP